MPAAQAFTKGSWMVHDARRIPDFIARARLCRPAPPGASDHLGCAGTTSQRRRGDVLPPQRVSRRSTPWPTSSSSNRPSNCSIRPNALHHRRWTGELRHLRARAMRGRSRQMPLFTEDVARPGGDDHPLCLGFFERGLNRAARLLREADVVLMLGRNRITPSATHNRR